MQVETTKISSGSEVIDELLQGGYEKKVLSVIYGPSGTGKTTLCLSALKETLKGNKVLFIDTEGGFSPERLEQLTQDSQKIFENLIIVEPVNFKQQHDTIMLIDQLVDSETKMVVCDTLTGLYRSERAFDSENTMQKLTQQASKLLEIARERNIPVLISSQVYTNFDNEIKLLGGDVLHYRSKCIIELVSENGKRKAILQKHKHIPKTEIEYKISNEGIVF